mgnify:FL=1
MALRRNVLGVVRLGRIGLHIVVGVATIWSRFGRMDYEARNRAVERWAGQFLRHAGIELQVIGPVPASGPLTMPSPCAAPR